VSIFSSRHSVSQNTVSGLCAPEKLARKILMESQPWDVLCFACLYAKQENAHGGESRLISLVTLALFAFSDIAGLACAHFSPLSPAGTNGAKSKGTHVYTLETRLVA